MPCLLIALATSVTYDLDGKKTELLAITAPGGLPGIGHPHVIVATQVTGEIEYDAAAPEASRVKVSFPTDGLRADDAALRRRAGMEEMSDGTRESVNGNLRADDQLSPRLFPTISFESTSVRDAGNGKLEVQGKLALRGVEKPISVQVSVSVKDDELIGTGTLVIRHSDFKFKPYSAALGAVKNLDEISLRLKLVGQRRQSPGSSAGR